MGVFHDKMLTALRGHSQDTQRNYLYQMKQFVKFHNLPPDKLGLEDIYACQVYLIDEKKISFSSFNITVAAIRFFYNRVMDVFGIFACNTRNFWLICSFYLTFRVFFLILRKQFLSISTISNINYQSLLREEN